MSHFWTRVSGFFGCLFELVNHGGFGGRKIPIRFVQVVYYDLIFIPVKVSTQTDTYKPIYFTSLDA